MRKVITYGTFDLLHFGHIKLLERAKKLGDYLIVGVTSDGYDITRGKINNHDSLMERVEAVKRTGLADQIIIEEYEGQKIDDIKRFDVDIFTVGDDWKGKFDYLSDYCEVIYLTRTEGISSSQIRDDERRLKIKLEGNSSLLKKYRNECSFVNGLVINNKDFDAVFLFNNPEERYNSIKKYLLAGKHVLCESPIALKNNEYLELNELAKQKGLVLMEAIKTAYSVAFNRLLVLLKSGKIGHVVSVDAVCTSLKESNLSYEKKWNSMCAWAPTALLPVFEILGTNYKDCRIVSKIENDNPLYDGFSKIDLIYENAVACVKVAKSAKCEGQLVITGTKGYVLIPSPWWKTDFFEIRYEDLNDTKKYFYQLDGEGIRNELVSFVKTCETKENYSKISNNTTSAIIKVIEKFYSNEFIPM